MMETLSMVRIQSVIVTSYNLHNSMLLLLLLLSKIPDISSFSRDVVYTEKSDLFEPPYHPQKTSKTKSLTFLLQPICHFPLRFGVYRLSGLEVCDLKDILKNKDKHKIIRVLLATLEGSRLTIIITIKTWGWTKCWDVPSRPEPPVTARCRTSSSLRRSRHCSNMSSSGRSTAAFQPTSNNN